MGNESILNEWSFYRTICRRRRNLRNTLRPRDKTGTPVVNRYTVDEFREAASQSQSSLIPQSAESEKIPRVRRKREEIPREFAMRH